MGKSASKELKKEDVDHIVAHTTFSTEDVFSWYSLFIRDCPTGKLRKDQFLAIYESLYPESDAKQLSDHVFRAMDKDGDRQIDFTEFITALNIIMHGNAEEKLNFAFNVCDADRSGQIDKLELHSVVEALLAMPSTQPITTKSPAVITNRIFATLDGNNDGQISRTEFVRACMNDHELCDFLTSFYI